MKSPPSLETRPTSDRLRETLFNILAPRIKGLRFFDLCAGSGAVGIEALSRGVAHVTFVDQSAKMAALIETNLETVGIDDDQVAVLCVEALAFFRRNEKKEAEPFDIIFFDPPYATDYAVVLDWVGEHAAGLLADEGVMIVEHHRKNDLKEEFGRLKRYRVLKQGDSVLSFYSQSAA